MPCLRISWKNMTPALLLILLGDGELRKQPFPLLKHLLPLLLLLPFLGSEDDHPRSQLQLRQLPTDTLRVADDSGLRSNDGPYRG